MKKLKLQRISYHDCIDITFFAALLPCVNLEVFKNIDIWLLPHCNQKHL